MDDGIDVGVLVVWLLVAGVLFAVIGSEVGRRKGLQGAGFVLGFLLGPIGVLIVGVMTPSQATLDDARRAEGFRRCPFCAEMIRPDAVVCRYCQRDVPNVEPRPVDESPPYWQRGSRYYDPPGGK